MSLDELDLLQSRATTPADEYHWYLLYQLIRGLEWLKLKVQSGDVDDDDDDEVRMQQQQLSSEARESLKEVLDKEIEEANTDNLLYAENLKREDQANKFPQAEETYSHDLRLGKFRQQEGYDERLERFRREWTEEAALERIAELFGVWSDVRKKLGLHSGETTSEKDMVAVREHMQKTVADRQAVRFKPTYSLYPKVPEEMKEVMEKRS
ncbi:uncharacterized protein B0T23DRAFT_352022 [Neurospora hispaniola]|uniref:Uncharacterized protein n=1 Tax=Neurospora hispaniola TaxID=588809 RepID=A0AAJ0IBV0_9PEZI|nr:hypothetical protein B0T23DRAFT_352022 [Neurospora hispaniola]